MSLQNNNTDQQITDYEELTKDIQKTIKEQDDMYREIQGTTPDENKKYKLEGKISNLKERRDNIFAYLQDKYNNNTILRKTHFDELYENKKILNNQEAEIKYLNKQIHLTKTQTDTETRKINIEKYEHKKFQYYFNLYIIIACVFVALILVLLMIKNKMLSNSIGGYIIMIGLILLLAYVLYYVYLNNYNRDKFHWDKLYFDNPSNQSSKCEAIISEEDIELSKLEKLAAKKINDFNTSL